ncbi:MAG: DUF1592 domain-containing protein [Bryobacterales bacterium]|nr:DUF1592 domain-containing protein [Bryobacterales bacterium]
MHLRRYILAAALLPAAWYSHAADTNPKSLEPAFTHSVKPFLTQYCQRCHNVDNMISGVRVDHLDASLDDRHIRLWEAIRHRVNDGTMPPKGMAQPTAEERRKIGDWTSSAIGIARLRPSPKNGLVRRLTVAQYRNTLRELLNLEDDLTEALPPEAISRDGFVNNKDTLQLSPLLTEAYLEIAEEALNRSIVDPKSKPAIQNFRVDLGASINPAPIPDELVLGANSLLLENKDFSVHQLTAKKPFPFDPFFMRTKYRFIEGYQGNDTVRGWRDFDSIYHSVFACMRGSRGYPKGLAYSTVPQGLLLRPAIPNDETFEADGTYGPKANFKISLRELPDNGRFRVKVTAAKYNDGLLLDSGAAAQPPTPDAVTVAAPKSPQTAIIKTPGIYQVDVHTAANAPAPPAPDATRLSEALALTIPFDGSVPGTLEGSPNYVDSPFGKALALTADSAAVSIPATDAINVGDKEFTIAAWIHPKQVRRGAIASRGGANWIPGWTLDMPDARGALRLETTGPDTQPNGTLTSPSGVIRMDVWQHVAAVVRRGKAETSLYVNGFLVAKGVVGAAVLDNPKLALQLGRAARGPAFRGDIDEVRLYRRALGEAELQALIEPGRKFAQPPPDRPKEVHVSLGDRQFSSTLTQPAFLAVRLPAGPLKVGATVTGVREVERVVITPIAPTAELARRLLAFEKRIPRLGVHLGLRRDCGSTFAPVGSAQSVASVSATSYVFEGAIRNFPSPDVEKDNVNYLAGVREIAVRSEYTDGRDMPRLLIRSVEFEGPFYDSWPPPPHRGIFIDSPRKTDPPAYARDIIRSFAARAYRRPVTAAEETALFSAFDTSYKASGNFQMAIKDVLQVVLTSPQFLFLVEKSATPAPEPIENFELASKLSYFLWNGPPDQTTRRLASAGVLRNQLDAEVNRMVADPRFTRFTKEFTSQWLSLDKIQILEPDRKRFPKLTRDARIHLREEPIQFVQHLILNNLPVRNLIASDFIVANEAVASYYGLGDKTDSGLRYVAIQHNRPELGGVLTQAAIMAGLSDGRESNPVKRGAWLARKIVAEPPADPPPNVPALKEANEKQLTLRQRLEQHRSQPGCMQCHSKIDPWGVPFEEFDAAGLLKTQKTESHSTLPDKTEVAGVNDLKRYLAQDRIDQVAFSVLKHLATYATGRTLTYSELNFLKQDALKLKPSGYRMRDMISYVVHSKLFIEK